MTPNQIKVMQAIKNADDWITIKQISTITGISTQILYVILQSSVFKNLEVGYQPMKVMNRLMDVKIYRVKKAKSSTSEALKLAKQHQGVFGQLFWGSHGIA